MVHFGLGHLGLLLHLVHGINTETQSSSTLPSNNTTLPSPVSPSDSVVPAALPSDTVPTTLSTRHSRREIPTGYAPDLPTSNGFWVAGLVATDGHGGSYSQIISGPNQHIQCVDIGNAVFETFRTQAVPHYVIEAYIIEDAKNHNVTYAYTADVLAATEKPIVLGAVRRCPDGGKCFKFCNGAHADIQIAGSHGTDSNQPVPFATCDESTLGGISTSGGTGMCIFINTQQTCRIIIDEPGVIKVNASVIINYLWDCVGMHDSTVCAGNY